MGREAGECAEMAGYGDQRRRAHSGPSRQTRDVPGGPSPGASPGCWSEERDIHESWVMKTKEQPCFLVARLPTALLVLTALGVQYRVLRVADQFALGSGYSPRQI